MLARVARFFLQMPICIALSQFLLEGPKPIVLLAARRPVVVFPKKVGSVAHRVLKFLVSPGVGLSVNHCIPAR